MRCAMVALTLVSTRHAAVITTEILYIVEWRIACRGLGERFFTLKITMNVRGLIMERLQWEYYTVWIQSYGSDFMGRLTCRNPCLR